MKVYEAAEEAVKNGKAIRRGDMPDVMVPTNTYDACVGFFEFSRFRRWNPTPEDLAADDWEVVELKRSEGEANGEIC